jgi:hypothetical protein
MSATLGILAIGSLYWDDNPNREAWRISRLDRTAEFTINVPIRYGRKSETRGNTYTMVYSRSCQLGQAKACRCSNDVASSGDLIAEAEQLWAAERSAPQTNGRISANWGAVAVLTHPHSVIPQELLDGWAHRVGLEPDYGFFRYTACDGPPISDRGFLQIAWPTLAQASTDLPLDLLLATVTNPTLQGNPAAFPSAETIADAWKGDIARNVEYFWSNRKNGILTFEDQAIKEHLLRHQ